MERNLEKLTSEKNVLEVRVKDLERQVQSLRTTEEAITSTKGLIQPLTSEITRGVQSINTTFNDAVKNLSEVYRDQLKEALKTGEQLGTLTSDIEKYD